MTREELASELFNLIVIKGRWADPARENIGRLLLGGSLSEMPEFVQELWLLKADEFAEQNTIPLKPSEDNITTDEG